MSAIKVTNEVQAHTPSVAPVPKQDMSGVIQRLSRRLGIPANELAAKIPADTVRRTKYPVLEQRNDDGTTSFISVRQVIVAPHSTTSH